MIRTNKQIRRRSRETTGGKLFKLAIPLLVLVATFVIVIVFRRYALSNLREQLLIDARSALQSAEFAEAESLARRVLTEFGLDNTALEIAGESAMQQGHMDIALQDFEALVLRQASPDPAVLCAIGNIRLARGDSQSAEDVYRAAVEEDPDHTFAMTRLVFLLAIQGRRWESLPYLAKLVQQDRFSEEQLFFVGNVQAVVESTDLEFFLEANPEAPGPQLGQARLALSKNELDTAERLLRELVRSHPKLVEAHVQLGYVLLERGAYDELATWQQQLPREASEHPDIWAIQGLGAAHINSPPEAIRCFWECLRLDPNHQLACYQIGLALAKLDQRELAERFQQRYVLLHDFTSNLHQLFEARDRIQPYRRIAELSESLGRYWEAWGWYRSILLKWPGQPWAEQGKQRTSSYLSGDLPLVDVRFDLAKSIDFSSYPLPQWRQAGSTPVAASPASDVLIHFQEVTSEWGVNFKYFNGDDPTTEGRRMFEFTGGGVGMLDFDNDTHPDLYLTQGTSWPPDPDQMEHLDGVYRSLDGREFREISALMGIRENGFSQGVAAGDFNNDGFDDIWVGNVGENRLYRNNGDGTFSDVSELAGIGGARWTTSLVIADVNGDSVPDLFEVNYLQGDNVFDLICNRGGKSRSCSPTEFDAQQDRLFLGRGDGTFVDVSQESGAALPDGKGLGVVAADFDGDRRLDFFIANDMTANFLLLNDSTNSTPRFVEAASLAGVAYDRDGKVQACMGIGVEDVDRNGLLDLFITNFYHEANTLYLQQPGVSFVDASRERGIKQSSYEFLGFGTQFLDADLDGWADLVIANGHVDDFTHQDIPFTMPPQFLRNVESNFTEVPGAQVGPYFERKLLGRGLAKGDINGDGLEDFVVSHLDAPASVVLNTTQTNHHGLTIELRGRTSSRSAIGTKVRVKIGDQILEKQLSAGDGYLASNQRCLVFGLGNTSRIAELEVEWPSGIMDRFANVEADQRILLREGDPRVYQLHSVAR
ncbi:MAG TPA: FG-GAP-like repeat-containing protein [Pirellulaceae bacterium]|nr:FG-GAP-like repeat-containing protein [Pirellulaceae bacterium]